MKFYTIILSTALLAALSARSHNTPIKSVATITIACDDVPELNKQIMDYVKTTLDKKVGSGECWDLAATALNTTGASWDKDFKFGKEVDPKKECIYPGDIIQFTNVTVQYAKGNARFKEKMAKHTAVIYEVKGPGDYVLADQNTSTHGRKVGLDPINLANITGGKYVIYRPQK